MRENDFHLRQMQTQAGHGRSKRYNRETRTYQIKFVIYLLTLFIKIIEWDKKFIKIVIKTIKCI